MLKKEKLFVLYSFFIPFKKILVLPRFSRKKKWKIKKINYKSLIINRLEGLKPSKRCCIAVFALKTRKNQNLIEKLSQKHPSAPYNLAIANVFFKAGLIEAWGRGTLRILDDCRLAKTPIPIFQYDFGGFIMKQRVHTDNANGTVNGTVNDTVKVQKVFAIIRENPAITRDQIATQLALSKRTIQRYIQILKKSNQLIRKGSDKSGFGKSLIINDLGQK